jgi:hypothetical protein
MNHENENIDNAEAIAEAIVDAAHILANNRATSPNGTPFGGMELHGMTVAASINNLAAAVEGVAYQMERIADALNGRNTIEEEKKYA